MLFALVLTLVVVALTIVCFNQKHIIESLKKRLNMKKRMANICAIDRDIPTRIELIEELEKQVAGRRKDRTLANQKIAEMQQLRLDIEPAATHAPCEMSINVEALRRK